MKKFFLACLSAASIAFSGVQAQTCTTLTVNNCPGSLNFTQGANVTWTDPTGTASCPTCPTTIANYDTLGNYGGSRYFRYNVAAGLTWDNAQADAVAKGGNLVCIESSGESSFIDSKVAVNTPYFIGAKKDASTGNVFKWVNGSSQNINSPNGNWASGEPLTANSRGYIVRWGGMTAPKWFTESTGPLRSFFIEVPCAASQAVTVTRTDNGPAKGTAWAAGTYTVTYQLSNSCGCTKTCSFTVNVTGAQTGCTSTTPISGFDTLGVYNNHRYYISQASNNTWDAAQTIASNKGGFLVSIETVAESNFINGKIQNPAGVAYFIGAKKDASTGNVYKWVNGQNISFTNWASGEPLTANSRSVIVRWSGMTSPAWFTEGNGPLRKFIMEVPCPGAPVANRVVKAPAKNLQVKLYPNPAGNFVQASLPENIISIDLYDLQGRKKASYPVAPGTAVLSIDTRELAAGVYWLRAYAADGTVTRQRFVKAKQ
jgi:Secretion system C-terminal sorting domain/Lectin C-type domain